MKRSGSVALLIEIPKSVSQTCSSMIPFYARTSHQLMYSQIPGNYKLAMNLIVVCSYYTHLIYSFDFTIMFDEERPLLIINGLLPGQVLPESIINSLLPRQVFAESIINGLLSGQVLSELIINGLLPGQVLPQSIINGLLPVQVLPGSIINGFLAGQVLPELKINGFLPRQVLPLSIINGLLLGWVLPESIINGLLFGQVLPQSIINDFLPGQVFARHTYSEQTTKTGLVICAFPDQYHFNIITIGSKLMHQKIKNCAISQGYNKQDIDLSQAMQPSCNTSTRHQSYIECLLK